MTEDKAPVQEVKLEPDSELRFEIEGKNEKVTLEVCYFHIMMKHRLESCHCILF